MSSKVNDNACRLLKFVLYIDILKIDIDIDKNVEKQHKHWLLSLDKFFLHWKSRNLEATKMRLSYPTLHEPYAPL